MNAESFAREVLNSEEYRVALRKRLVDGTARAGELEIAKRLGLGPTDDGGDDVEKKRRLVAMPEYEREIMLRLIRKCNGTDTTPTQQIVGAGGGLVFLAPDPRGDPSSPYDNRPEAGKRTETVETVEDDESLLPPVSRSPVDRVDR